MLKAGRLYRNVRTGKSLEDDSRVLPNLEISYSIFVSSSPCRRSESPHTGAGPRTPRTASDSRSSNHVSIGSAEAKAKNGHDSAGSQKGSEESRVW